jgi:hypothetical protein
MTDGIVDVAEFGQRSEIGIFYKMVAGGVGGELEETFLPLSIAGIG